MRKVNSLIKTYFNNHKQALIGPRGAAGPAGADATKLFVQVKATPSPSIVRGSGATAVAGPADTGTTGLYTVTFNRDLSACVAVASRTSSDGNFPGIGGAAVNHADATSLNVQTFDNTGAASSTIDFAVAVFCSALDLERAPSPMVQVRRKTRRTRDKPWNNADLET